MYRRSAVVLTCSDRPELLLSRVAKLSLLDGRIARGVGGGDGVTIIVARNAAVLVGISNAPCDSAGELLRLVSQLPTMDDSMATRTGGCSSMLVVIVEDTYSFVVSFVSLFSIFPSLHLVPISDKLLSLNLQPRLARLGVATADRLVLPLGADAASPTEKGRCGSREAEETCRFWCQDDKGRRDWTRNSSC